MRNPNCIYKSNNNKWEIIKIDNETYETYMGGYLITKYKKHFDSIWRKNNYKHRQTPVYIENEILNIFNLKKENIQEY